MKIKGKIMLKRICNCGNMVFYDCGTIRIQKKNSYKFKRLIKCLKCGKSYWERVKITKKKRNEK